MKSKNGMENENFIIETIRKSKQFKSQYEVYASYRHVQLFRMLKPEEKLIDRTYSEIICCAEIV